MPKASPLRSSFNAGELSPLMDGRTDIAKYQNGCKELTNFIPSVQGPAIRRPGTRYVEQVPTSAYQTWLSTFQFSTKQAYVLEWSNYRVRIYTNSGILLDPEELGYVEITTPYAYTDLTTTEGTFAISTVQSGDILFVAHPSYPLYKLSRFSDQNWVMERATLENGPFQDQNTDRRITMYIGSSPTELVVNGEFTQNINSWATAAIGDAVSADIGWTRINANDGKLKLYKSSKYNYNYVRARQTITTVASTTYTVVVRSFNKNTLAIGSTLGGTDYVNASVTTKTDVTNVYTFTATGTSTYIEFTNSNANKYDYTYIDSISIGPGVTLTASEPMFNENQVDSLIYLEPSDLSNTPPWTPGEEFKVSPAGAYRRSDGKTYVCTTTGAPGSGKLWRTGADKPVHTSGTQADGGGNGKDGTNCEKEGLDWKFIDAGYVILKIVKFIDNQNVNVIVMSDWSIPRTISSTTPTYKWAFAAFSLDQGWPEKVTFFRERLTLAKGQRLYFSVAGDFQNFAAKDDSGDVVPDRAINVQIASDQVNQIQWLAPQQNLLIGTTGYEFRCGENSSSEAFAPANVKIEQQTLEGSKSVQPVSIGFSTLFVQRAGRKLKEMVYSFQSNGYVATDMTVLSEHITQGGIVQIAWQKEPYMCLWCVRGDGTLLGFTFNKEQDVIGWHKHELGGDGIVESVAVIPHPDGNRDQLWMIVRRTINGSSKRYVEYLEREYQEGDTKDSAFYVDCGLTYSGTPATTISGLSHLEGKTVAVLADGAAHPDCVVTSGAITLQRSASKVHIGLAYESRLQTNRIEAGAGDGTAQGKMKRINKVVLRFYNTLGGEAGPNSDNLDQIEFRKGSDPMDASPPLFTGDKLIEWPSGYDFDGYIYVKQSQPLPMTLVAAMPQVTTFDR